ncbi:MAG: serine/threonine-protein kinase [Acidobacteriota bacterium]
MKDDASQSRAPAPNSATTSSATSSPTLIIAEALELEGDELRSYLDETCGDDAALRAEVESLLDVADERFSEAFLETPAAESWLGGLDDSTNPPRRIGDFELLNRLGEGGMGAVYLAQQHNPRRKVAIKLVRGPHSDRLARRFAGEWQALARLNHPYIAALYEVGAGAEGATPFVAMEWVDGPPITIRCDEKRLGLEERLRIFLRVCEGVGHAHEKGILHCDLKPSNILLTQLEGRQVPKVVDFGIARALDEPLYRQSDATRELVIGSPPYISPEAAAGGGQEQIDVRTDVHALGLVLYELLVGVLPFELDGLGLLSALRKVSESDPAAPGDRFTQLDQERRDDIAAHRSTTARALRKSLRGDLDAIVLKATERDPRRRYGSPAAMAADIERYLDSRPIEARRPTALYVARRFARRHATLVAAVALVVMALAAGLVARSMEAARANRALAESEQIRMFLLDLFENADPERAAGSALTVDELLRQGTERLQTDLPDLPLVRAELLQTIGTVSTKLDHLDAAEEAIREALETRRRLLPAGHPDLLTSKNELGVILRRLGQLDEAETLLAAVLEARLKNPEGDLESLARAHSNLGNVYFSQRKYAEAEIRHREALRLRTQQRKANDSSETRNNEAISASNLGVMLRMQHKHSEAREPLLLAVKIFREENPTLLGSALNNLGIVERYLPTWRRAEGLFREATEVLERSLGPSHSRSLRSRRNLILALIDQFRLDEALDETRVALGHAERSEDQISLARVWETAGEAQRYAGRIREAIESQERCLELAAAAGGGAHPVARKCLGHLALVKALAGEEEKALDDIRRLQELEGDSVSRYAELGIFRTLVALGQFDQAVPHIQRYRELSLGRNDGLALFELAQMRASQGANAEAYELYRQAWQFRLDRFGPDHPLVKHSFEAMEAVAPRQDSSARSTL